MNLERRVKFAVPEELKEDWTKRVSKIPHTRLRTTEQPIAWAASVLNSDPQVGVLELRAILGEALSVSAETLKDVLHRGAPTGLGHPKA